MITEKIQDLQKMVEIAERIEKARDTLLFLDVDVKELIKATQDLKFDASNEKLVDDIIALTTSEYCLKAEIPVYINSDGFHLGNFEVEDIVEEQEEEDLWFYLGKCTVGYIQDANEQIEINKYDYVDGLIEDTDLFAEVKYNYDKLVYTLEDYSYNLGYLKSILENQ